MLYLAHSCKLVETGRATRALFSLGMPIDTGIACSLQRLVASHQADDATLASRGSGHKPGVLRGLQANNSDGSYYSCGL